MAGQAETSDILINGAGQNGLTCAGYLARAGYRVKVVGRRGVVGGAAVTEEFHTGFRNSVCSYLFSLLNPKEIRELERFGLTILDRQAYSLGTSSVDFPSSAFGAALLAGFGLFLAVLFLAVAALAAGA